MRCSRPRVGKQRLTCHAARDKPTKGTKALPNQLILRCHSRSSTRGSSGAVPVTMSERVERPKKKTTTSPGKPETEDMPPTTPRKRKARKAAEREPPAHEVGRIAIHAEPTSRGIQGRRSDRELACFCQPYFAERDHSCSYPVSCAGAPTSDVVRAASDVYGYASSPQIKHVQSWFTTSQKQTG